MLPPRLPTRHLVRALRVSSLSDGVARRSRPLDSLARVRVSAAQGASRRTFFWQGGGGDSSNGRDGREGGSGGRPSGAEGEKPAGGGAEGSAPDAAEKSGGRGVGKASEAQPRGPVETHAKVGSDAASQAEAAAGGEPESTAAASSNTAAAIVPVNTQQGELRKDTGSPFNPHLMAFPLPRRPLFPGQQQLLQVSDPEVMKEVMALLEKGTPPFVGAFLRRDVEDGEPGAAASDKIFKPTEDSESTTDVTTADVLDVMYGVGTRARIVQVAPFMQPPGRKSNGEGIQVLLHGHDLIRLDEVLSVGPPLRAKCSKIKHSAKYRGKDQPPDDVKAYVNETMHTIREIMKINPQFREHASMIHVGLERLERGDPHAIAHFAASLTTASGPDLMEVLESDDAREKLRLALMLVKKELELAQIQQKISSQIDEKVSKHQRELMLREQMRMIKKELGEDKSDGTDKLLTTFRERLEDKTVPKDAKEAIESEIEKFSQLAKESQEYQITRNYLDWLTVLPWGVYSKDVLSLSKAKEVLDRDHYGLSDVKERILELIAVGQLRGSVQGKILCFVGPPGVGKTSIGRSIAEALDREFYRFSVGGLYDVAEIKGHRRTYVGAMPGKVVQCLKKAQTANPLVLIDEVDKIGRGHQGDPASALLELLDPSQNGSFLDHYLDVPVDCSRILFVCTANVTDTIPGPLLDRMEVIRLSGYDSQEKLRIAEDYLVPAAMREVGLWPPLDAKDGKDGKEGEDSEGSEGSTAATEATSEAGYPGRGAAIDRGALEALIRWYCREAGVRNLQKHVEKISRKLATKVVHQREAATPAEPAAPPAEEAEAESAAEPVAEAEAGLDAEIVVTAEKLSDFVGKQLFTSDRLYEGQLPAGTVTGLAWTAMGGSVLYIEATALPRPRPEGGGSDKPASRATPSLAVTGQLGSVMKESSQLALLVARKHLAAAAAAGPDADVAARQASFFESHELYLHCPEGATPKDGPSAGVTMVTALLSLALERPVRADLAMTGEVSLNGKVLAVGGIKEKTIAARRAGCSALLFPAANRRDFEELPEYLREGLEVHFATDYVDVFRVALPAPADVAES